MNIPSWRSRVMMWFPIAPDNVSASWSELTSHVNDATGVPLLFPCPNSMLSSNQEKFGALST